MEVIPPSEWKVSDYLPAQYPQTVVGTDFRAIGLGPRGYKESNKRKMQDMEELSKTSAPDASAMEEGEEEVAEPTGKRQKADDGVPRPVSLEADEHLHVCRRQWRPRTGVGGAAVLTTNGGRKRG